MFFVIVAHTAGHNLNTGVLLSWSFSPAALFIRLLTPFLAYQYFIDLLYFVVLFMIVRYAIHLKRLQIHAGFVAAALFLFFISVISPNHFADEPTVALRFPFMAILLLFAAVLPEPFEKRQLAGSLQR